MATQEKDTAVKALFVASLLGSSALLGTSASAGYQKPSYYGYGNSYYSYYNTYKEPESYAVVTDNRIAYIVNLDEEQITYNEEDHKYYFKGNSVDESVYDVHYTDSYDDALDIFYDYMDKFDYEPELISFNDEDPEIKTDCPIRR